MIICHSYKFIFIKTMKTAGTSLELALMNACGPDDIMARIVPKEPRQTSSPDINLQNASFIGRKSGRQAILRQHSPLSRAVELLGDKVFDYKIITSERNPWQKLVSSFFWKLHQTPRQILGDRPIEEIISEGSFDPDSLRHYFREFCCSPIMDPCEAYHLYAHDWVSLADYIIRFEHLADDLATVSQALALPSSVRLPRQAAKGNVRPTNTMEFLFCSESDAAIRQRFAREISMLGYTENGSDCPTYEPFRFRGAWKKQLFDSHKKSDWVAA